MAKRRTSAYVARRSDAWLKIKCQRRQEFVIGGYTDPQGSRARFGALHLGLYDGARLVYVSKVGTGFDGARARAALAAARAAPAGDVARSTRARRPGAATTGSSRGSSRRCGTPTGRATAGSVTRRTSGSATTCAPRTAAARRPDDWRLARPASGGRCVAEREAAATPPPAPEDPAPRAEGGAPASRVRLTNLDKVFWPAEGYTKGDLIRYYDAIAPMMLPYLRDRPIVLTRYPDGIAGKSFFQKDAPEFAPDWVRTERVYSRDTDRDIDYFVVDDAETLRYVANMGTIPIHAWSARVPALERPDWLVLDLDPKGAPFTDVVRVAQAVHRLLDDLELPSHVKTSGATGLHVLVPLGAQYTHEQARTLARLLATLVVEAVPGDRHGGAPARRARRQGLRRLRPERPRPHDRRAVLGPAAPGRPGLVPPRVAGGDRAARSRPLHDPHRAARASRGGPTRSGRSSGAGIEMAAVLARMEARLAARAPAAGSRSTARIRRHRRRAGEAREKDDRGR